MIAESTPAASFDAAVLFERIDNHIALVTLNRAQARNAINGAVAQALDSIVRATENDPQIRAVILTGAGAGVFCAGADLKELASGKGSSLSTENGGFAGFVFAKRSKPWIAAVNGKAIGGGFELALACDLVVASDSASFCLPEVSRGLVAIAGGVMRLPRQLPRAIALELIATGAPLTAQRAEHFGLVNRVVGAEFLLYETLALAQAIVNNAPIAVCESLSIARQTYDLSESELKQLSSNSWNKVIASDDFIEGPRAFLEKRAPSWTGA
ncbi:enoyl-CoA hydratase-related protein [Sapientia aquatica]|uniref:Enoyl-CoA hydratase n=1 Tax=Sapientia aquatica TaxID=1549640 RepID=A0A4R5W361_9BURK|nr:enoyl-CoA hydratase-related protein [Sapientia aquatica]TDK65639.1 enoyl-CoA hydratase [Sapientia aquatica]